jgi:transcription elongation GreA/GreB family factor
LKISIILPLFYLRNAGWKSLESALSQRHPRDRHEIVAGVATPRETGGGERAARKRARRRLSRW